MRLRKRWFGAVAAAATALTVGALLAPAAVALPVGDPTWAEVQRAKHNASAKAAEVQRIEAALAGLEQKAAALGAAAIKAQAAYSAAERQVRAAQASLASLEQQAAAAEAKAKAARRTAGTVATQLYRSGDPTLSVWLSGTHADSLLYRLGALSRIGDSSAALLARAVADERTAAALGDQAKAQAHIRDQLAAKAKQLSDRAKAAQRAADAQVAATKARTATLQAELRSLQATSNALQASYAAAQAAKAAAAAAGDGGGGGALSSGSAGPGSLSPGAAQSYAQGRMAAYGWDGSQFDCLVRLWNIESGWQWNAYNPSSGAYGIPQALPADKLASSGSDWRTSSATQIEWGLGYIQNRYSTPCGAYAFETSHVPYWY
ncbi:MAG: coiled-coil domain-containing protein [Amnibacterium sp.]